MGVNYLTSYDTQPDNIERTCIPLAAILKELGESKSGKLLFFIDACRSGFPITSRSIAGGFSEDAFSQVFSPYCDTVVIEFSRQLDLEEKIDAIEAVPELEKLLKYEADCSSFTLVFPRHGIRIHVMADRMTLSAPGQGSLKAFLSSVQNALTDMSGFGVGLFLQE